MPEHQTQPTLPEVGAKYRHYQGGIYTVEHVEHCNYSGPRFVRVEAEPSQEYEITTTGDAARTWRVVGWDAVVDAVTADMFSPATDDDRDDTAELLANGLDSDHGWDGKSVRLNFEDGSISVDAVTIEFLTSQRDAMRHRAESAEADWQAAEKENAALRARLDGLREKAGKILKLRETCLELRFKDNRTPDELMRSYDASDEADQLAKVFISDAALPGEGE